MKSFIGTDPASHKGISDTWLTPLNLIPRIGIFDLDPCAYPGHLTARSLITEKEDGLKTKWAGKVWLNPPYSNAEIWIDRLMEHGLGATLLFARTDSKWLQKALRACDYIQFIRRRISFIKPDGEAKTNAGSPSIVLYFGMEPIDPSLGVIR